MVIWLRIFSVNPWMNVRSLYSICLSAMIKLNSNLDHCLLSPKSIGSVLGKNVTRLPHFLSQVPFLLSHASFRDHILDLILDEIQFK